MEEIFMTVDRIIPAPLTEKAGKKYAALAYEEFCGENAVEIRCLGGGSFGMAFSVTAKGGSKAVVKFLRADGMLSKEAHDLKLLGSVCPIKMPEVFFTRPKDGKIPLDCYGMELIDGKPLFFGVMDFLSPKSRRAALAERITDALHEIHLHVSEKFGDTLNPAFDDWTDYYRPFAEQVLNKAEEFAARGELNKHIVEVMRAAMKKFDVIFEEKVERACLIHGDLNVVNILKKGDSLAFIDPLGSAYADVEYDLFQFYNLTGRRYLLGQTYREKYGESKRCDDKLAFYGLWNEVFCFIKSGVLIPSIMNPLVKNMKKRLKNL